MNVFEVEEELTHRLRKAHPGLYRNTLVKVTVLHQPEMCDPLNQLRVVSLRIVCWGNKLAGNTNSGFPENPTADDLYPCLEEIYGETLKEFMR